MDWVTSLRRLRWVWPKKIPSLLVVPAQDQSRVNNMLNSRTNTRVY